MHPFGLVDQVPAAQLRGSGLEAEKEHVVWSAMLYYASWQMTREAHGTLEDRATCHHKHAVR